VNDSPPRRHPLRQSAEPASSTTSILTGRRPPDHATGVDAVVAAAGVSKPTLYAHFRSESELVAAVLERRHTRPTESLQAWVTARTDDPRQRPLAVFAAVVLDEATSRITVPIA